RRALHADQLNESEAEAQKFAEAMAGSARGPAIYATRGNTAVGKSRAVKGNVPELKPGLDASGDKRSINPDNFKQRLMTPDGQNSPSDRVPIESRMPAPGRRARLKDLKTANGKPASIVVDKRLAKAGSDVGPLINLAKESDRQLVLNDIDAP